MLQLYRTLFLGYLRYSLPVLTNACRTSIRTIENAQGQALRVCLGLPRCTSTAETIAIAKDHPATMHITLEALRAHIRHLARAPAHHLASLPEDRPSASFCKRIRTYRECLPTDHTPPERILTPPWCLYRPQLRLTVPGIRKKADLSSPALKQLTLLMLHEQYKDHVKLYTDGSTTVGGSAGAVIFPAKAESIQFRTSHKTTSTAAELAALRSALRRIDREVPLKWSIFTDSKPALQCLRTALRRGPQDQLLLEIRQLYHQLTDKGHDITFQWLPGHCGITGNEHADDAAKNAHENGVMEPIPLSRSDAAAKINTLAHDVARSMWNTPSFLHTRLHRLDPCLQFTVPSGLPRSETTVLCRMWLGVSFTNAFACRIGWADSAACEHCGTDETIQHVLCECPQYSSQRQSLAAVLARLDDQPLSEKSILECRKDQASRRKATKALLKFLRATRLVERL
uniref:ribonuclease H n=1 Tax=Rhipicephalus pulchellus TaxID=72859 RepID=L7LZN4_RHIPC